MEFVSPPAGRDPDLLDADHDEGAPLRYRKIEDILAQTESLSFAPQAELHAVSSDEPASFDEAERSPCWRKAMMEEMDSIEENRTWTLADLPLEGRRLDSSGCSRSSGTSTA